MEEIVAAIIGAAVSGLITWQFASSDLGKKNNLLEAQIRDSNKTITKLNSDLSSTKKEVNRLSNFKDKYQRVKNKLQASSVVREYVQPVILVGPRAVGKTSLLAQWHAPWDHSRLDPTQTHSTSMVPIYDFKQKNTEPHFADPEILTDVHIHLKLRVHDFPGELGAQKKIVEQAIQETLYLRKSTGKSLGIVLICMFDSEEAGKGLTQSTIDYYNGELFGNLRRLVAHNQVGIERLVLVFNKYDLLKKRQRQQDDVTLLNHCLINYHSIISLLRGTCNPEKVCEVFTILSREDMAYNNRGAPIVLGESAREFVKAMAGGQAVQEVIRENATNYAAPMFS